MLISSFHVFASPPNLLLSAKAQVGFLSVKAWNLAFYKQGAKHIIKRYLALKNCKNNQNFIKVWPNRKITSSILYAPCRWNCQTPNIILPFQTGIYQCFLEKRHSVDRNLPYFFWKIFLLKENITCLKWAL